MMKCVSICLLAISLVSQGHNNLFFPGDAYFSSEWKFGQFDEEDELKSIELRYSRLSLGIMACGYAGCEKLKIEGLSLMYQNNLKKVNELLLNEYKALASKRNVYVDDKKEINRFFRLLVYNKDYDFKERGLAFKYNEDWARIQKVEAKRRHAIYDGVGGKYSVLKDWEGSSKVKGLKTTHMPKDLTPEMGVEEAVKGNAADYVFIIPLSNTIDRMMEGDEEETYTIAGKGKKPIELLRFIVVAEKIQLYEKLPENKWQVTEL